MYAHSGQLEKIYHPSSVEKGAKDRGGTKRDNSGRQWGGRGGGSFGRLTKGPLGLRVADWRKKNGIIERGGFRYVTKKRGGGPQEWGGVLRTRRTFYNLYPRHKKSDSG